MRNVVAGGGNVNGEDISEEEAPIIETISLKERNEVEDGVGENEGSSIGSSADLGVAEAQIGNIGPEPTTKQDMAGFGNG